MKIRFKKASELFFCGLFLIFLTVSAFSQNMFRKINDFDGDGKADFAVTRDIDGLRYWYIWQTTDGFRVSHWGIDIDLNAAGDYDGDGKTDLAILRKEIQQDDRDIKYSWWINGSLSGVQAFIGTTNSYPDAVPHQQDYDGDGMTDKGFTIDNNTGFRNGCNSGCGTWHLGGKPLKLGDTNGDGRADVASYDLNTQSVKIAVTNNVFQYIQFGLASDQYVPADFDGDGKGDLTVFRESDGTWWWLRSSDNVVNAATFGTAGDVPVPADYDGDGKTDIAIWRSGPQSYYWVYGSQVGVFALPWGISGDSVVTY